MKTSETARVGVSMFQGTQSVNVPDMDGLFERVASKHSLTKRQGQAIREAFEVEPGDTLYYGINAITRAGNDIRLDLEARRELQQLGGSILEAAERGARWLN